MRLAFLSILLAATGVAFAQPAGDPWDSSGNSMLSGTFYFRQVVYAVGDSSGDLGNADTLYGEITFDGKGGYTISASGATGGAVVVDAASGSGAALPATSGTYAIGGGGYGYIVSPAGNGDVVFGMVSANGVFLGSSTDNPNGYNDMFIAGKIASPAPTTSSFNGAWTFSDFDSNPDSYDLYYYGYSPATNMLSAIFTLNPDGSGHLNAGTIKAYANGSPTPYTQTSTGLTYTFSNGAAVATFPNNGSILYGQKYFYFSPDGNFAFGGAPNGFDMIVGVKTTTAPALSGLYYQVGLDAVNGDIDTYFGSVAFTGASAPQTLLGHQRINDFGGLVNEAYGAALYDYTYTNTFSLSGNSYSTTSTGFVAGAGGGALISVGQGGTLGISIALQAPSATGTGVYLSPQGVLNSASYAPATARIAPGELITLFGSNLAPSVQVSGIPFPTTGLNGVQVTIGGYPAAIYYVSQTQMSVIVPYEVTVGKVAAIQVNNNGTMSNIVTQMVSNTAPGVFTQTQSGTGYGDIEHIGFGNSVSPVASVVTDSNPAVEGETLSAYLTGLGAVSPPIADGAAGPSGLSKTTNTIAIDFSGSATGTNDYSGLAPGYSGLYQLNFTIPSTGITVGPNYLDILGSGPDGYPDSYMSYLLIPIQATPSSTTASSDTKAQIATPLHKLVRPRKSGPATRIPVRNIFLHPAGGTGNE